ncbi:unnamed protein product [marine sediment metagenome]|uniref:Carbohydrate-binding module family 96 domain-containing protein n=1 Tax=marine sediment metagenome TaxID=412755 RepID=X1CNF7_9ZZZZ
MVVVAGVTVVVPVKATLPIPLSMVTLVASVTLQLKVELSPTVIVDADLKLYQWGTLGTDNFTIGLYKVTSDWDESTIDWDPQPTCSVDAEITSDITWAWVATWRSWDIDTLAQAWLDGSITNYGVVLKDTDEASVNTLAYFLTSDYTVTSEHPKLEIDYYDPTP